MTRWAMVGLMLLLVLSVLGCIGQGETGEIEYFDDAIKLETQIAEKTLPGQRMFLNVWLTNQVDNAVSNVNLYISDPYSLKIIDVNCGGDGEEIKDSNNQPTGCHYNNIPSISDRTIGFELKAPETEEIGGVSQTLKPEITLEYLYSGQSVLYFPILRWDKPKTDTKEDSPQTYGPIKVDIERGYRTETEGEWEREGGTFSILVDIKDVVSPKSHVIINKNEFNIELRNVAAKDEGGNLLGRCDFSVSDVGKELELKEPLKLPLDTPLICALKTTKGLPTPEVSGVVKADFSYKYRFVKVESIDIETSLA